MKAKTITIANHKGGVGKTTTTINLGAALHLLGKKVLLIDLDGQSNLTDSSGINQDQQQKSIYGAMKGDYPLPIIHTDSYDIVPSSLDLAAAETELINFLGRERILDILLEPIRSQYDYILIDCPPSLGLLTINALSSSDSVIIPVQSGYYAMKGLEKLMSVISDVKKAINPKLRIEGILITMYDGRENLSKDIADMVREDYSNMVFKTTIRKNVALGEASINGNVFTIGKSTIGREDYENLCDELLNLK